MSSSPSKQIFDHVRFDEGIQLQYLCDVCKNPLLDAEIATPCGHSFCGFCVNSFRTINVEESIACQMCRQSVVAFCQNRLANNILAMVEGECIWCHQRFPLNMAKDHVRCCGELETECEQCRISVKRTDRDTHMEECLMANVYCDCGASFKRAEKEEHIKNICALKEIDCPLKCGKTIKRCMTASHSLTCVKVAIKCPIAGCGHNIRRDSKECHMFEHQANHVKLLQRQMCKALWSANRGLLHVTPVRANKCVLKWSLGDVTQAAQLQSPTYEKFSRKWKFSFHVGTICLKYEQGLDEIAVVVSFIVHTRDGRVQAYVDMAPTRYMLLNEGDCTKIVTGCSTPPAAIIARIEITEPSFHCL